MPFSAPVPAVLADKELDNYSETAETVAASTAATALDLEAGNVKQVTLSANTTFTFANPAAAGEASSLSVILIQDATGSRTVTWPASVKWAGGTAPMLTTTANRADVLTFLTVDGGTNWLGFTAGQNFTLS